VTRAGARDGSEKRGLSDATAAQEHRDGAGRPIVVREAEIQILERREVADRERAEFHRLR
jgi:hypothetical protein